MILSIRVCMYIYIHVYIYIHTHMCFHSSRSIFCIFNLEFQKGIVQLLSMSVQYSQKKNMNRIFNNITRTTSIQAEEIMTQNKRIGERHQKMGRNIPYLPLKRTCQLHTYMCLCNVYVYIYIHMYTHIYIYSLVEARL